MKKRVKREEGEKKEIGRSGRGREGKVATQADDRENRYRYHT